MDESWFNDSDVEEFFESIASGPNKEIENEDKEKDDGAETDGSKKADLEKGMNKVYKPSQIMWGLYNICSFK